MIGSGSIKINEGFDDEGNPDSKYYAFDWDDNILYMPTKIMVLTENDDVIGMSTEDFAKYRSQIGKTPFEYNFLMLEISILLIRFIRGCLCWLTRSSREFFY